MTRSDSEKTLIREKAIQLLLKEYSDKPCVVAGHYSFPLDENDFEVVMTSADELFYTHVIYLDLSPEIVYKQRVGDQRKRMNQHYSAIYLKKWMDFEKKRLSNVCAKMGIKFTLITENDLVNQCEQWVIEYAADYENNNKRAIDYLSTVVGKLGLSNYPKVWLIDGDKTLSTADTGRLFWNDDMNRLIKTIFSKGYLYGSFLKVCHFYEQLDEKNYLELCERAAQQSILRDQFVTEIRKAQDQGILVVVVSSGIRECWEMILERNGLTSIPVLAGNRSHGFVVDSTTKESVVEYFDSIATVFAFGDSEVDFLMLAKADFGFVVDYGQNLEFCTAGNIFRLFNSKIEDSRNSHLKTIHFDQILQFSNQSVFFEYSNHAGSLLLSTKMRNSRNTGYQLRQIHEEAGVFMAHQIANRIGVEKICVDHVQGQQTVGYKLKNETSTAIVPLMRAGEPMANGMNRIFDDAMFFHAKTPMDISDNDFKKCTTILLVDAVLNTGKSIREFISDIMARKELRSNSIELFVVVGVTQSQAISGLIAECQQVVDSENCIRKMEYHSLRVSKNKYKGIGGTDTGHRLFLTFHRDQ
jgi:uracil phosphoribosyltransferase/phosphoserine phosphatase